jgi:hypothetical protein
MGLSCAPLKHDVRLMCLNVRHNTKGPLCMEHLIGASKILSPANESDKDIQAFM